MENNKENYLKKMFIDDVSGLLNRGGGVASGNGLNSYIIKITEDNYVNVDYTNAYIANYDEIYDVLSSGGIVWIDGLDIDPHGISVVYLVTTYFLDEYGLTLGYGGGRGLLCTNGSHNLPPIEE